MNVYECLLRDLLLGALPIEEEVQPQSQSQSQSQLQHQFPFKAETSPFLAHLCEGGCPCPSVIVGYLPVVCVLERVAQCALPYRVFDS